MVLLNTATKVYSGNAAAKKVYLGTTLVWSAPISWTPASIPGLVSWYDASQLTLADGAQVTSWTDLTAGGRHLLPNAQGTNPTFKTNGRNSLSVVRFNGTSNMLTNRVSGSYNHFFVVAKYNLATFTSYDGLITGYTGGNHIILIGNPPTANIYVPITGDASGKVTYYQNGVNSTDIWTSPFMTVWGQANVSSVTSWINFEINVGLDRSHTPRWWNGDVGEIIGYSRVLTDVERQQVEGYLKTKWGTP